MVTEEASVVAAASYAAKLLRSEVGIRTTVSPPLMIGQIQLLEVPDLDEAQQAIEAKSAELVKLANEVDPMLVSVGGGAIGLELHRLEPLEGDDPVGAMLVAHLIVDVRDAMGANAINSMCERLAEPLADLSGGRVGLRILSNLADRRTVTVHGQVPFGALKSKSGATGETLAHRIVEASVFAERDPYRAATHNKGIMNGIDAVLLAFGQDWRAVEAGAHAFAARSGRYTALARWRVRDSVLHGELQMPMAVGTIGGVIGVHPTVRVTRRVAQLSSASDLASIIGSVGLAQNLGALRALASEGIQHGHMRLHARNVAVEAGAEGSDIEAVAQRIAELGSINVAAAKDAITEMDAARKAASEVPEIYREEGEPDSPSLVDRFEELHKQHMPDILRHIDEVVSEATREDSSLIEMCRYHMETGGKRLRAVLPMLVAEGLQVDAGKLVPFGAACEMLHNATLVHDDLLDGDVVRRGHMTIWNRFGVPQAVALGDAMLYYSVLLTQRVEVEPSLRERIARRLVDETIRVIDGQEREFALRSADPVSLEAYFTMVEGKTSGLFALPMGGAAELCGAPSSVVGALREAATHMGVLFQIQDDMLDLYGDEDGEQRGSDIGEGKRSLLVAHACEHASDEEVAWLQNVLDRDRIATFTEDVDAVIELFERVGSSAYALAEIARRQDLAVAVPALQERPELVRLVAGMCDLFAKPIEGLRHALSG